MIHMRTSNVVFVCVCVAALTAAACETDVGREAAHVRARTVPPDGRIVIATGPDHLASGVEFHWEFDVPSGWRTYAAWVREELEPDFEVAAASSFSLSFRRYRWGDAYDLTVEVVSGGLPSRLRGTLKVRPR